MKKFFLCSLLVMNISSFAMDAESDDTRDDQQAQHEVFDAMVADFSEFTNGFWGMATDAVARTIGQRASISQWLARLNCNYQMPVVDDAAVAERAAQAASLDVSAAQEGPAADELYVDLADLDSDDIAAVWELMHQLQQAKKDKTA